MKISPAKRPRIDPYSSVEVKQMGNIIEVKYLAHKMAPSIKKLDADTYIELSTGELKEFTHADSRADNKSSVAQSFKRLRDLINFNVNEARNCLWITLTYQENQRDEKLLYDHFRKFNQRLQYYCQKNGHPRYEYIVAMEPQNRGAWHAHMLAIFPSHAPFIPNSDMAKIWGLGYTKTAALRDTTAPGFYLTAYLTDLSLSEAITSGAMDADKLKFVDVPGEDGKRQSKAIIKGGRLKLYPVGFRVFRKSAGVKYPPVLECTEAEAMQIVGAAPLVFDRTIELCQDNGDYFNTICYRTFNRKAKGAVDSGG